MVYSFNEKRLVSANAAGRGDEMSAHGGAMQGMLIASVEKLAQATSSLESFKTSIYLEQDECIREAQIVCEQKNAHIACSIFESPGCLVSSRHRCNTLLDAFKTLMKLHPAAMSFPNTLIVDVNQNGSDEILADLALEAWRAAFAPSTPGADANAKRHDVLKENLFRKLSGGAKGVTQWNSRPLEGAQMLDWRGSDLSGLQMEGIVLRDLNFEETNFSSANLKRADLYRCQMTGAIICGADLSKANLIEANLNRVNFEKSNLKLSKQKSASLRDSNFSDADLTGADLRRSDLRGAHLESAITTDANFDQAIYDENTKLPAVFPQWSQLRWTGAGANPYQVAVKALFDRTSSFTFEQLIAFMQGQTESKNMKNALKMLKKNRYQLFSVIEKHCIRGIIRSQKDPEKIYGCSLAESGEWICGTEDLMVCDSMRSNEICKHIFVLALGLARAQKIDLAVLARWIFAGKNPINLSTGSALAEVFLYYKASKEDRAIDWRPTETIPEDYHAF